MKYNIIPIILGNNCNDTNLLYGSVNDAILIYNLFYTFYLKNTTWKKPYIFLNINVKLQNIINFIKKCNSQETINYNIFLIYFSGHSDKNGNLQFHQESVSSNTILKEINKIFFNTEVFFIIDSCFSSNFISSNIFNNINKIRYLVSCDKNQKSKEIVINYDDNMFKNMPIENKKPKIVIGIFTFYLYKSLKNRNITDINYWGNIINDNIWFMIEKIHGQKIYYHFLEH